MKQRNALFTKRKNQLTKLMTQKHDDLHFIHSGHSKIFDAHIIYAYVFWCCL